MKDSQSKSEENQFFNSEIEFSITPIEFSWIDGRIQKQVIDKDKYLNHAEWMPISGIVPIDSQHKLDDIVDCLLVKAKAQASLDGGNSALNNRNSFRSAIEYLIHQGGGEMNIPPVKTNNKDFSSFKMEIYLDVKSIEEIEPLSDLINQEEHLKTRGGYGEIVILVWVNYTDDDKIFNDSTKEESTFIAFRIDSQRIILTEAEWSKVIDLRGSLDRLN